jgi:hypothetical protein
MVEVRLRVGVGIAVEGDRQGVDARDLEGPGAHRADSAVWTGDHLRRRHPVEEVLGDDARAQRKRERGGWRLQRKHDLVEASGSDAHLPPVHSAGLRVLEVLENVEGEQHIGRGERLTVGPLHALTDVERVGQVVGGDRPVGCELPDDVLLRVHGREPLIDHAVDVACAVVGLEQRVQDPCLPNQGLDRRTAACRLRHSGDRLTRSEDQHRRQGGGDDAATRGCEP